MDLNLPSLTEHTIRSLNHIWFDKTGELRIWTTSKKVSIRLYYVLIWVGVAYMKPRVRSTIILFLPIQNLG